MTPEEKALGFPENTKAAHTEARACRQIAPTLQPGDVVHIAGQREACSNCKGRMNETAAATGAKFEYDYPGGPSWSASAGRKR